MPGAVRLRRRYVRAATGRDWHDSSRTELNGKPLKRTAPLAQSLRTAVVILIVLAATTSASAQTTDTGTQPLAGRTIPLAELATQAPALPLWDDAVRRQQLEKWIAEFSAWKEWALAWGNRPEPGWFSGSRARRQKPDPPMWLFQECAAVAPDGRDEACQLLAEWSVGSLAATQTPGAQVVSTAAEDADKITWWEHVHLDAGWPALQSGVGIYGVLGMHATTTVRGRFQVFIAPGAMLLNVPTVDGGRAWRIATNYGIAYRLGEFTVPGTSRHAYLHLNLAKAWLLSAGASVPTRSTDFAGLSITFRKTP
jgi:hypothetical protein